MSAEIGILLVHGIGEQTRGETLVNMGQPLCSALKNWIESASSPNRNSVGSHSSPLTESKVYISDAILSPADPAEPAHIRLRIGESPPLEWVVAESHWASSFPRPDPGTVTRWLMRVLPWICASFLARRLRIGVAAIGAALSARPPRLIEAARRCGAALVVLIVLPLISPLVLLQEVILFVLLIVGLVPLGVVHDLVLRIQTVISAILGDSFIYTSSEIGQQAAISKIAADLEWLGSKCQCKRIVVLAHSQGAALSYLTLSRQMRAKVRLLVTFGSGLLKLYQLSAPRQRFWIGAFAFFVPVAALYSFITLTAWLGLYAFPPGNEWWIWIHTAFTVAISIGTFAYGMREETDEIRIQASEFKRQGLKWIDVYASMDPVPNGRLFLSDAENPESIEVCNDSSLINDHNSYRENDEEFLLLLVRAIGQYSGTQFPLAELTPLDAAVQDYAKRLRPVRIFSKKLDEFMLLAALIAILSAPEALRSIGVSLGALINTACNRVGFGICWRWPPVASGLLVTAVAYVGLRLCLKLLASIWAYRAALATYKGSTQLDTLATYANLFSHAIAGVSLSGAAVLHYSQTFSWVAALHRLLLTSYTLRFAQSLFIGFLFALVATMLDMVRLFMVGGEFGILLRKQSRLYKVFVRSRKESLGRPG